MDVSAIIDSGQAYRYILRMVKYASKGESRSKETQKLLTQLVNTAAAEQVTCKLQSMVQMLMIRDDAVHHPPGH